MLFTGVQSMETVCVYRDTAHWLTKHIDELHVGILTWKPVQHWEPHPIPYEEEVQLQTNKASTLNRIELLTSKMKKAKQVTPLDVTVHPDLHLFHILHDYQCIINISSWLKGTLPKPSLLPTAAYLTLAIFW